MKVAWSLIAFTSLIAVSSIRPMAAAEIAVTPIGTPSWQLVDTHLFSGPIGTAPDFADFFATLTNLLPPPNHVSDPVAGILPGAAHPGPYDEELSNGVNSLGFVDKTMFSTGEFSGDRGVYLIFMIVPGPGSPTGSSPDFASGPIIPNSLLPIHSVFTTDRNGDTFSNTEPFDTVLLNGVAGYSHIPNFYADSFVFASNPSAGVTGSYEYHITLTDALGNGWNVTAPFQVVPEPATKALLGIGFVGVLAYRRSRYASAPHVDRV
jgi:hypothetical protein